MQIAISTNSLANETLPALDRAKTLGFNQIELNLQNSEFSYGYNRKPATRFYRGLKKILDELRLSVWSTTTVEPNQRQMFFERARKDMLMGSAVVAGMVGSKLFVVQPADIFHSEMTFNRYLNEKTAPPTIEGYDEAWVQAANRFVSTTILNTDYWIGIPLTNQVAHMQKVTQDLGIGWAWDVRASLHRNSIENWLAGVGERAGVAYLYDRNSAGIPTLPMADDWAELLPQLQQTRLKTVVIQSNIRCSDTEISECRQYLSEILASSTKKGE